MKTCSTCRFMAAPRADDNSLAAYDDEDEGGINITIYPNGDAPPPTRAPHQTCVRIIHGNRDTITVESLKTLPPAVVVDGSGYAARLRVLPSFGCVLHEERDNG